MQNLLNDAREPAYKHGGNIRGFLNISALSEYGRAIYTYLKLIVSKNFPYQSLKPNNFEQYPNIHALPTYLPFVPVIFQSTEMVGRRIKHELRSTKGAVNFDGWSFNNVYFTGVIAWYCTTPSPPTNSNRTRHWPHWEKKLYRICWQCFVYVYKNTLLVSGHIGLYCNHEFSSTTVLELELYAKFNQKQCNHCIVAIQ